jgi:thioredoxin reductase
MIIKKDIIIIGGGPAGIATAIQLKRYNINLLIIEKNTLGGLLKNAFKVENYLGFPEGIKGEVLVKLIQQHCKKYKIDVFYDEVIDIDYDNKFIVKTKTKEFESKIVVIASGTKPKAIKNYNSDKIFYEVYKIKNVKDKTIGIIGAGDAAFDYALTLAKNNKVLIFNHNEKNKCNPVLFEICKNNNTIKIYYNRNLDSLQILEKKIKVVFQHKKILENYLTDYIIFAIGRKPQLNFFHNPIKEKLNYLTDNDKLFIIGDVANGIARQASIAAGDGIKTAMIIKDKTMNRIPENYEL